MLDTLRDYYKAHGISALEFRCKHQQTCSAHSTRFTSAQETFVGPEYTNGALPRLLFMSLDSGNLDADPATRTMDAVRRRTLADDVYRLPKGKHCSRPTTSP